MNQINHSRIRLGITQGDINGIGYEIIMKTFSDQRMLEICTPVLYGITKVASYHRKTLNKNDFNFNVIRAAGEVSPKMPNIINLSDDEIRLELGKSTPIAGEWALKSIEHAVRDLQQNQIDGIVTAPINKKNIQSEKFHFAGHTEYLQHAFGGKALMLLVSGKLRIGVITGHIPLREVPDAITGELITDKINSMEQSLMIDFGIRKPRIAVLSLNPHAGDDGVLGNEDSTIVKPAIQNAFDKGTMVFGPYPADGFFGSGQYNEYDGILAMYHDQGLAPFKALAFSEGVNFTAGLPIVRTSPVHGTAYNLAGKDMADPSSFRHAVYAACDIIANRREHEELTRNPLGSRPAGRRNETDD